MSDYVQIVLTAVLTGVGTGVGIAVGTYFANRALIQNVERLVNQIKKNSEVNMNDKRTK